MGEQPFKTAWKNIYEPSESVDRLVTEEEVYELFLQNTPSDRTEELKEVYQQWHGSEFEDPASGG